MSLFDLKDVFFTSGNPADAAARATASDQDGDIKRVSTKEWARSTGYDPVKLFNKVPALSPTSPYGSLYFFFFFESHFYISLQLFKDDIMYLLTMDKLWKKRKAPLPLEWEEIKQLGGYFVLTWLLIVI